MKLLASVCGVAAILTIGGMSAGQIALGFDQDADKDLGNFQGQWTVMRSERDGEPEPAKELETLRVTISGCEFLVTGLEEGGFLQDGFLFLLDPSRTPKTIDASDGWTKKVHQGIYLLAEDRLTICGEGNMGRPKEFSSKDGQSLLVLQRAKEPAKPGGKDSPKKLPVPKTSPEQDVRKMQGRWKIVAAEDEGQNTQEEAKAIQVVITGNKIVLHNSQNERDELIVSLRHPDKRPKEIDLTVTWSGGKAESLIGIYSLADGELRLCFNMVEGQPRPGTFKTKPAFTSRALFVLKRVQDEDMEGR